MEQNAEAQIASLTHRVASLESQLQTGPQSIPAEPAFDLRFILIKRTTDVAAFVALILSVLAVIFQLGAYFAGPDLKAFPPRQIVIYNSALLAPKINFGEQQVLFAAITSYANRAPPEHPALVLNEFLRATVGSTTVQHWLYNVGFSDKPGTFEIEASSKRPIPFVVAGNNGFSHEVLFEPFSSPYCLAGDHGCRNANTWFSWGEFIAEVQTAKRIEITLGAELYDHTPALVSCVATLTPNLINILGSQGWLAPECFPKS